MLPANRDLDRDPADSAGDRGHCHAVQEAARLGAGQHQRWPGRVELHPMDGPHQSMSRERPAAYSARPASSGYGSPSPVRSRSFWMSAVARRCIASLRTSQPRYSARLEKRPSATVWSTKSAGVTEQRHAQPGEDDTLLVDARGRAAIFGSGEPSGLVTTLPAVLTQLREVPWPDAKILLGFDRGGACPSAFRACRQAGADWVTYRRAPLVDTTLAPRRSWTIRGGQRISVLLADEIVELKDYGSARQLTLVEDGKAISQALTSDLTATGASLLCWLRARWRIENMLKYAVAHNGIDSLADYQMDLGLDTRKVPNPAWVAAPQNRRRSRGQPDQDPQADRDRHPRGGTGEDRPASDPGQSPGDRPGPRTRTEPAHDWNAEAYKWCCGCWRSTPKRDSPSTSRPTWSSRTSTA